MFSEARRDREACRLMIDCQPPQVNATRSTSQHMMFDLTDRAL